MYFEIFFQGIILISIYGKLLRSFVYVIIYCVGEGITTFMSISDGLDPYFFPSKDGKHAVRERRNGRRAVYLPPVVKVGADQVGGGGGPYVLR